MQAVPRNVPKSLRSFVGSDKVIDWSFEPENRGSGSVYWATLAEGFCTDAEGCHTVTGGTVAEFLRDAATVQSCACKYCKGQ